MLAKAAKLFCHVRFELPKTLIITTPTKRLVIEPINPPDKHSVGSYSISIAPPETNADTTEELQAMNCPSRWMAKFLAADPEQQPEFEFEIKDEFSENSLRAFKRCGDEVNIEMRIVSPEGDSVEDTISLQTSDFFSIQEYVQMSLPYTMGWSPTVDQLEDASVLKPRKSSLVEDDPNTPVVYDFLSRADNLSLTREERMEFLENMQCYMEEDVQQSRKDVESFREKNQEDPESYPRGKLEEMEEKYKKLEYLMKERKQYQSSKSSFPHRKNESNNKDYNAGNNK